MQILVSFVSEVFFAVKQPPRKTRAREILGQGPAAINTFESGFAITHTLQQRFSFSSRLADANRTNFTIVIATRRLAAPVEEFCGRAFTTIRRHDNFPVHVIAFHDKERAP
jgi:hypothetical protein